MSNPINNVDGVLEKYFDGKLDNVKNSLLNKYEKEKKITSKIKNKIVKIKREYMKRVKDQDEKSGTEKSKTTSRIKKILSKDPSNITDSELMDLRLEYLKHPSRVDKKMKQVEKQLNGFDEVATEVKNDSLNNLNN